MRRQIKPEEGEDSDKWLKEFMPLYKRANPFIQEIIKIDADADSATVKSFADTCIEGYQELLLALHRMKAIPKPKEKELGKLGADFESVLINCLGASQCARQLAEKQSRFTLPKFTLAKLVFWAGMAKGRMEDCSKILASVSREDSY